MSTKEYVAFLIAIAAYLAFIIILYRALMRANNVIRAQTKQMNALHAEYAFQLTRHQNQHSIAADMLSRQAVRLQEQCERIQSLENALGVLPE